MFPDPHEWNLCTVDQKILKSSTQKTREIKLGTQFRDIFFVWNLNAKIQKKIREIDTFPTFTTFLVYS